MSMSDMGVPIPDPVKQNALKAFGRLCSAAMEIPSAYLEGIADEIKAETRAREKLIETTAMQITELGKVDKKYARAAFQKYAQKILRGQVNLDQISEKTMHQLSHIDDIQTNEKIGQMSNDWINHYEEEASKQSSENMQQLFAKILAGEIRRPSSFSIKAVKIMGEIDGVVADLFKRLCSICIVAKVRGKDQIFDARVLPLSGTAGDNALQKYGLGFDQLNILHEYGLIIADYNSWRNYAVSAADKDGVDMLELLYQNTYWDLLLEENQKGYRELKLYGVALSKAGQELFNIVEIEPVEDYTKDLVNFFAEQKIKIVPIKG